MRLSAVTALALLLLTACAAQRPDVAPNDELAEAVIPTEDLAAGITETKTVWLQEIANDELVCEYQERLGSRIAKKTCYFRSEQLTSQSERDQQVYEEMEHLRRQEANRDSWEQIRRSMRRSP